MSGTPRTVTITSSDGEPLGFVCIDSTVNGRARGGLRLMPDVSEHELALLARDMTLKYGFLGLPHGGAKAGVIGDPEAPAAERAARLAHFAERALPLLATRAYVPDADMGTTGPEIQAMLQRAGVRVARREYRGHLSGLYTAATVFESAWAAMAARRLDVRTCRVAIEGFGRVGRPLAEMFAAAGAAVVAISTRHGGLHNPRGLDLDALTRCRGTEALAAAEAAGLGRRIAAADLKFVHADVLCPCARHESITQADAERVGAAVLSCGANSPLAPGAERRLWERGITCVPDFVANAGGVLGGTMEFAGWRRQEILDFCARHFRPRVASLLLEAERAGQPVRDIAEAFAVDRFARVKSQAEDGAWTRTALEFALARYRNGWLPARLVQRLSSRYFRGLVG
jgi:glutamate dehydrogenase/leucine dehydrogenase